METVSSIDTIYRRPTLSHGTLPNPPADPALTSTLPSDTPPQPAPTSREAMSAARLPIAYRDSCAHLLIPLNRCRFEEYYLPWKCEVRFALPVGEPARVSRSRCGPLGKRDECGAEIVGVVIRRRDIAMRSASTRSLSCGLRRWMS